MSLTQGGEQLAPPSILPAFQGDVNTMTGIANSLSNETLAPGAFQASPGMTGAAGVGNNYFGAGNTGSIGTGQLNNILSGANLNPASNPYLSGNIDAMRQAFTQTLGQGEDQINSQFQMAGQTGANSGARNNAMTKFAQGSMKDFSNSLTGFLGNNYMAGQNQITQALGLMNQPLQGAGMASALGQAPGMEAYQGQLAQNQLTEVPFNLLDTIMKDTPVSGPAFSPSGPSNLAGWMNLAEGKGSGSAQGAGSIMQGIGAMSGG